ncbi:MAG TPA: hypothetical protein VFV65_07585 [Gemmatimonadales bacterium]|nr:hypothetical protein [Gemmatimonadales bacterium]
MSLSQLRHRLTRFALLPLAVVTLSLAGCESDEPAAPESHTPESAKLFVNDVDVSADLLLAAGAMTTVEVRFYDAHGDQITGIEDHHYAGLVFTPTALATAVGQVDAHFFLDVTAQAAAGTGTVMVGYGHDVDADELAFGPFPVTVEIP